MFPDGSAESVSWGRPERARPGNHSAAVQPPEIPAAISFSRLAY